MALMFARLARNFIKNGYFPTDEATLERILPWLAAGDHPVRLLDPCCGEGSALAEIHRHLERSSGGKVHSYGIEFDAERAWAAKQILVQVAHSDAHDVTISPRSIGLLFLNPPYGDLVADRAQTGDRVPRRDRLEKMFYRLTMPWLQFGGVLVLIVPHYALDREFAGMISRHCEQVHVFMAPEQRFRQCVVFGVKRRADHPDPESANRLQACGAGELPPLLPEPDGFPYAIPPAVPSDRFAFTAVRLDAQQLADELRKFAPYTLWPQFRRHFQGSAGTCRRPLRDISQWHLALALASGQIGGVVRSPAGRTLLLKGDTFKDKASQVEETIREDGSIARTLIKTDRFVAVIQAIDFTPGPTYGDVITIR